MTDIDEDDIHPEDREAEALERRLRQGSVATLVVFLVLLGLFWAGIYWLTQ
jgi:hypothetical protein